MSLRDDVSKYILEGNFAKVLECANFKEPQTCKYVQMNFFGDDLQIARWHAIIAIGKLAEKFSVHNDELYRNILRRELWAMNDESGNVPWSAPEVMASIIKANPTQYKNDFFKPMLYNGFDNPMCHKGLLWAIGFLGKDYYDDLEPFVDNILHYLTSTNDELRGHCVWALKQIGYKNNLLDNLKDDKAQFLLYNNEELTLVKICDL